MSLWSRFTWPLIPLEVCRRNSRGRWNVNHARLRVDGRVVVRRLAADPAHLMCPPVGLAHLRPRVRAHASEGVHFAGLGDNYSRDRLFPGTGYGNKRSREMEGASEQRRGLEDNTAGRQRLINCSN